MRRREIGPRARYAHPCTTRPRRRARRLARSRRHPPPGCSQGRRDGCSAASHGCADDLEQP
eukprot:668971-Prymnesium_polylepis.1